jgi:hypothetical protein
MICILASPNLPKDRRAVCGWAEVEPRPGRNMQGMDPDCRVPLLAHLCFSIEMESLSSGFNSRQEILLKGAKINPRSKCVCKLKNGSAALHVQQPHVAHGTSLNWQHG